MDGDPEIAGWPKRHDRSLSLLLASAPDVPLCAAATMAAAARRSAPS